LPPDFISHRFWANSGFHCLEKAHAIPPDKLYYMISVSSNAFALAAINGFKMPIGNRRAVQIVLQPYLMINLAAIFIILLYCFLFFDTMAFVARKAAAITEAAFHSWPDILHLSPILTPL
jgi:hypothetical protein